MAQHSKGVAKTGYDGQRLSTVSQRYEKARKRYVGNGKAEHRKAMAETGVQWRRNEWQWQRNGFAQLRLAEEVISIKFTVYGKPQGKARPRFTRQGRAYTPKNTVDYEKQIKQAYIAAGGTLISDTAPILICITACFKKAKSNKMQFPTLKPDTDNIAKAVCDALNGVAYNDDKQITCLTVDKVWADDGIEKVVVELNLKLIF